MTTFGIPFDPARLSAGASRDDLPIDLNFAPHKEHRRGPPMAMRRTVIATPLL